MAGHQEEGGRGIWKVLVVTGPPGFISSVDRGSDSWWTPRLPRSGKTSVKGSALVPAWPQHSPALASEEPVTRGVMDSVWNSLSWEALAPLVGGPRSGDPRPFPAALWNPVSLPFPINALSPVPSPGFCHLQPAPSLPRGSWGPVVVHFTPHQAPGPGTPPRTAPPSGSPLLPCRCLPTAAGQLENHEPDRPLLCLKFPKGTVSFRAKPKLSPCGWLPLPRCHSHTAFCPVLEHARRILLLGFCTHWPLCPETSALWLLLAT